jgi:hypothetical protein
VAFSSTRFRKRPSSAVPVLLTDFLDAHPEHLAGVRLFNQVGRLTADVDPRPLAAFLRWAVANRACDPDKVRDRWLRLETRYPDVDLGRCPV